MVYLFNRFKWYYNLNFAIPYLILQLSWPENYNDIISVALTTDFDPSGTSNPCFFVNSSNIIEATYFEV